MTPIVPIPEGDWHCADCRGDPCRASAVRGRKRGRLYANRDPEYKGYPYVVKFDDDTLPIYTDMRGLHGLGNRRRGELSDKLMNRVVPDEIILEVEPTRGTPTGPAGMDRHRVRALQASLQAKLETRRLTITTKKTDPYKDLNPTGAFRLRRVPQTDEVRSYAPDGTWLGQMTTDRLSVLKTNFDAFWESREKTDLVDGKPFAPFETEIGSLFKRYAPGTATSVGTKIKIQNHWATRDTIRRTIVERYHIDEEMFASPLNFLLHAQTTYCSVHKRDVIFGATYNAYNSCKIGMRVYANPEYEQKDLLKTLKWVIMASQHPEPFCAILVYPRWKLNKYMNLLTHHHVRLLAKFNRNTFSFSSPTNWETDPARPSANNSAKWQVMIIEVSNAAFRSGFNPHKQDADMDIIASAESVGAVLTKHQDPAFTDSATPYLISPPDGYLKLTRLHPHLQVPMLHATDVFTPPMLQPDEAITFGKGLQVYTDGSKTKHGLGAGYVIPSTNTEEPMKVAGLQTVNTAELTAILAVLEDTDLDISVSIFSDSLFSLQNTRNWIIDATSFEGGDYEHVLRKLGETLDSRRGHTHLFKIKAHVGHPGNESADKVAKAATKETVGVPTRGVENAHIHLRVTPTLGDQPLSNLKKQLRPVMIRWLTHKYDYRTTLHDLWTKDNPDIDPKPSNMHWNKKRPQCKSIVSIIFRLRNGDHVNQRLLWLHAKDKTNVSPNCPLGCRINGAPCIDSWIHMFLCAKSGAMEMCTARHNAACRLVGAAIEAGSMGRWLTLKNFGKTDGEPEEKTVPPWMLPQVERDAIRHNKPDFVIVVGWPSNRPPPNRPHPSRNKKPGR
jgi:ribonuclease HI